MSESSKRYQRHLDQVSRSFAFCIAQLREPLRSWVGLSYLLCRYVDTIEDAPWTSSQNQLAAFDAVQAAVVDPSVRGSLELVHAELGRMPIRRVELELIQEARDLLCDLDALPTDVREILTELLLSMIRGMRHFAERKGASGLKLRSVEEVNQYCFFVAGLVGEMLAKLLGHEQSRFLVDSTTLVNAHHFGQFLQKVNLLKDQQIDEKEGRQLLPDRFQVESSALANAECAFDFLESVPTQEVEFRRFCAWSLFLGLESLKLTKNMNPMDGQVKIERSRTLEILNGISELISSPAQLREAFETELSEHFGSGVTGEKGTSSEPIPAWLGQIYSGELSFAELRFLGLGS